MKPLKFFKILRAIMNKPCEDFFMTCQRSNAKKDIMVPF